ncbi:MAG: TlpA family protein disulfide reductase [Bacteroidia bacterium]
MDIRKHIRFAITIFSLGMLCISQAFSYQFTIKGIASGLQVDHVTLSSPAWFGERTISVAEDGSFVYYGSHAHPAMFTLVYGEGYEMLKADMFIFGDITIEAELVSDPDLGDRVFLRLPSHRSHGFKKAKDFLDNHYLNKPTGPSSIRDIEEFIVGQPYIGDDSTTKVFALAERLNYVFVLRHDYGFSIEHAGPKVFQMNDFFDLPINKEQFMGFEGYKNLMVHFNLNTITDPMYRNAEQASLSDFAYAINSLEASKSKTPEVLYAEMSRLLLEQNTYSRLSENDKGIYLNKLFEITGRYPDNTSLIKLKKELSDIVESLELSPAPSFYLYSVTGDSISLAELLSDNQAIVIDVWGSWCKPCRLHNKKLKDVEARCREEGRNIRFVSIANDKNRNDWHEAIQQDGMIWTQLLADRRFLENYRIRQYPTVILIDPRGVVRKVASSVSWDDIIEVAPQK